MLKFMENEEKIFRAWLKKILLKDKAIPARYSLRCFPDHPVKVVCQICFTGFLLVS